MSRDRMGRAGKVLLRLVGRSMVPARAENRIVAHCPPELFQGALRQREPVCRGATMIRDRMQSPGERLLRIFDGCLVPARAEKRILTLGGPERHRRDTAIRESRAPHASGGV